ncbi:M14 family metallocarboxypeptidase [Verrucomicrobium sp. BvORR034]|uniref:M14 family metallopeptidase n=1 Tax=Verrucomicrobium sp. BvORR034 TaxID=1396418 RepID=UPI0006796499|nr:M14 family metallocarboxypeptidase [Verrucomicrobium sp. BvORR034]
MSVHPLANHRAHDYRALVREWQALAKEAGLKMEVFARVGELPVYVLRTKDAARDARPTIYLSAGIHGDEAAAPWGLLAWARENVARFKTDRFLIFPVLNPHGLIMNTRIDQDGADLNRSFNVPGHPLITAWLRVVAGREFALALCLHEDYDGQGCYLYELNPRHPVVGHAILNDCARVLPIDQRKRIDGRAAKDGLIVRRVLPEMPGHPEAIVLHLMGTPLTLTFESPSEFSLHDRIEAQKTFIRSALEHGLRRG